MRMLVEKIFQIGKCDPGDELPISEFEADLLYRKKLCVSEKLKEFFIHRKK